MMGMASIVIGAGDVLVAVDPQNDFCPGGALAVPHGDEAIPALNRLAARFAHVVLTQDWHPAGHSSFASSHPGKKPFETVAMPYGAQVLWPDHCVQGTRGPLSMKGLIFPTRSWSCGRGFTARSIPIPRSMKTTAGLPLASRDICGSGA